MISTVMVAVLAAANREIGLPPVREKLSRNAQDWHGENSAQFTPRRDNQIEHSDHGQGHHGRLPGNRAAQLSPARLLRVSLAGNLTAAEPTTLPANHRSSRRVFLLEGVTQPENIAAIDSLFSKSGRSF